VRFVAFVLLGSALLIGGCRDPYVSQTLSTASAGSWKIEKQTDRITAAPISSSQVIGVGSTSGTDVAQPAGLQLMCFENKPVVRFSFEFKIGSDKNTVMGYRFDDQPGRENVDSRILLGYQVIVIEDPATVAQFLADMAGSRELYVRLRSLNVGRTTGQFKVDGADEAVKAAYADCPLPQTGPRRGA
jgi:hypothetical protein